MPNITSRQRLAENRKISIRLICVYISLGFAAIYFAISLSMLQTDRYRASGIHDNDLFFQADSRYAVENLTQFDSHFKRVHVHPMFVVMFNPIGQIANAIIPNPHIAASLVCALFGGLNVGLLFYFLALLKLPHRWVLLVGVAFGLSSTQLVFSALPDTYIFSATGMILLLIAGLKQWKIQYWAFITVYLLGITISNVIPALLAVFFFVFSGRIQQLWEQRSKVIRYAVLTSSITILLSLVQRVVYDSWIFTSMYRADKEQQFFFIPNNLAKDAQHIIDLFEHLFVFNVIAPFTSMVEHEVKEGIQLLSFRESSLMSYSISGVISWSLWIALLSLVIYYIFKYKLYQLTFIKAFSAILLFHFVLHFIYGDDLMLYTAHWTAILFGLIAYVLRSVRVLEREKVVPFALSILFCLTLAINNSYLVYELINAFRS